MTGYRSAGRFESILARIVEIVAGVMFFCLLAWIVLALAISTPTPTQSTLIEGLSRGFTLCLGALIGLLGGKLTESGTQAG